MCNIFLLQFIAILFISYIAGQLAENRVSRSLSDKEIFTSENLVRFRRQVYNTPNEDSGFTNTFGSHGQMNTASSGSRPNNNGNQGNGRIRLTTTRSPSRGSTPRDAATVQAECIRNCPIVQHSNIVCGSDNITYMNEQQFNCAVKCGRNITIQYPAACA